MSDTRLVFCIMIILSYRQITGLLLNSDVVTHQISYSSVVVVLCTHAIVGQQLHELSARCVYTTRGGPGVLLHSTVVDKPIYVGLLQMVSEPVVVAC